MVEGMTRAGPRPGNPPRTRGPVPTTAPRQVRIVGGRWKRSLLPVAALADLRPTPDRVRETLFNWLGQALDGQVVLDLFAGTGALGFEAASRGARSVTLVEANGLACRHLEAARQRLGATAETVEIVRDDASRWLDRARAERRRFDLILLDPPFGQDWIAGLLPRVRDLLADGGRVYVEQPAALDPASTTLTGWQVQRAGRAGLVHYHLLVADVLPDESPAERTPRR